MQIQNLKPLHDFTPRHFRLAEVLAEGSCAIGDAYVTAGFSRKTAESGGPGGMPWIGKTRERSYYPALYDYFRRLRDEIVGIRIANAQSVIDEFRKIAFADITKIVQIPERRTLQRAAIYAAEARKSFGYSDPEDEELLAIKLEDQASDQAGEPETGLSVGDYMQYAPGVSVKLKCLEDIPEEMRGAIAEIAETRDGIRVKMFNKIDALDRLAKINGMYNAEKDQKPITIKSLNIIVKGSRSNLLNSPETS